MTTPAPHPLDTNAMRKLCEAAPGNMMHVTGAFHDRWVLGAGVRELYDAARNALPAWADELDRLHAAEADGKARMEGDDVDKKWVAYKAWLGGASSDTDEQSFRAGFAAARAEIAHLTDAGPTFADAVAVVKKYDQGPRVALDVFVLHRVLRDLEAVASEKRSPPPAAADRGVPGQLVWRVKPAVVEHKCQQIRAIMQAGNDPMTDEMAWLDLEDARAALATAPKAEFCPHCGIADYDNNCGHAGDGCLQNGTAQAIEAYKAQAPKAEDVRREAIEECARVADQFHHDLVKTHVSPGYAIRATIGDK